MRTIEFNEIENAVIYSIFDACHVLNSFTIAKLEKAMKDEKNPLAKELIEQILLNASLAKKEGIPMCQDTGIVTCFVELGYDVHLNCDLYDAINSGVKKAYEGFYLRKSVASPIERINTNDNTKAIVHIKLVPGDKLKLTIAPKGAGSENMSKLKMLNPTDGVEGIIKFVVDCVKEADGRPCPPIFVGVGIGGNFEESALMAKEALLHEGPNSDPLIHELEEKIKKELNKLYIGPMGLGGDTTCLDVFINTFNCHIASLPVAVNIQCHANRHKEVII